MKNEERYFQKAKELAKMSEFGRAKIGCIAVYNNKIISVGINSHKTHPVQKKYDRYRHFNHSTGCYAYLHSLHAEIDCMLSVDENSIDMNKVDVFVYRITKNGMGLSKPCPACRQYLIDKGVKKIHYTTNDSYVSETYGKEN